MAGGTKNLGQGAKYSWVDWGKGGDGGGEAVAGSLAADSDDLHGTHTFGGSAGFSYIMTSSIVLLPEVTWDSAVTLLFPVGDLSGCPLSPSRSVPQFLMSGMTGAAPARTQT